MTADEEMRAAYGTLRGKECQDCALLENSRCNLTNKRRKCSGYGTACKRFKESGKYKFIVK